jgi:hypothetical protein
MKGKQKRGIVAAALGKALDALRALPVGPAPVLRPIPIPVRRPTDPRRH